MNNKKPKTNPKGRKIRITICVILAFVLLIFAGGYFVFTHYVSKLNIERHSDDSYELVRPDGSMSEEEALLDAQQRENLGASEDWDFSDKDVTNILLIGVDNYYAPGMYQRGNADGLIILSINKTTKQVIMTSLMRDIYVAIPDAYSTKITLTYHYGGTQVLIDTIEANFGIPIDNYALVNYIDVVKIIDAVGGLTLDVDETELFYMQDKIGNINQLMGYDYNDNMLSTSEAGLIHLNGVQTAAYLRIRMAGNNDFERTERARTVLLGLKDKAFDMSFTELSKLAEVVLPSITTDFTQGEIFSLILNASSYFKYEVVSTRIPIDNSFSFSDICGSAIVLDFEVNKEHLYQCVYEGKNPA